MANSRRLAFFTKGSICLAVARLNILITASLVIGAGEIALKTAVLSLSFCIFIMKSSVGCAYP
ncbi:hypothetical protein NB643_00460 [Oxalobacter aliiformigenes]|nr:hypothetical protein [Oxalobacter aliiformigenes]WAV95293.1 hypothetical protein NB643_00460 [Oxalobacter aliiformigenes]